MGQEFNNPTATADTERLAGEVSYLDFLARLHHELGPKSYLEIGVRHGRSLILARCSAVGVDPAPELLVDLPASTKIAAVASDEYFSTLNRDARFDFGFIDGLHLFEQALRDFMHFERHARAGSCVVIDDIFPNHPAQATRERRTRAWTGDVWKLHHSLRRYRPDLFLAAFDTHPTGSLLVAGLDPNNTILADNYEKIIASFAENAQPPLQVLQRWSAWQPSGEEANALIDVLSACYRESAPPAQTVNRLRRVRTPKLSVIVISYNMAREIPRTIRSLAPSMQQDIDACDYEVILVDNGSTAPFDVDAVHALAPNITIHSIENASPSPVKAINYGLSIARGELIGVCIDGARMASPGLLAAALNASRLHSRPVIGSLAFHLGPDYQARSVANGYTQAVEDELLAKSGWEDDGYRLFEIAAWAGSSVNGWFAVPSEANALFLRREHWRELGGYDEAFKSPGGGLVNLDTWKRALNDPRGQPIILLGEATFHQVHGGVATNAKVSPWDAFAEEYLAVRGEHYAPPTQTALLFGRTHPRMRASLGASLDALGAPQ